MADDLANHAHLRGTLADRLASPTGHASPNPGSVIRKRQFGGGALLPCAAPDYET